jgi:hypothetical protein
MLAFSHKKFYPEICRCAPQHQKILPMLHQPPPPSPTSRSPQGCHWPPRHCFCHRQCCARGEGGADRRDDASAASALPPAQSSFPIKRCQRRSQDSAGEREEGHRPNGGRRGRVVCSCARPPPPPCDATVQFRGSGGSSDDNDNKTQRQWRQRRQLGGSAAALLARRRQRG